MKIYLWNGKRWKCYRAVKKTACSLFSKNEFVPLTEQSIGRERYACGGRARPCFVVHYWLLSTPRWLFKSFLFSLKVFFIMEAETSRSSKPTSDWKNILAVMPCLKASNSPGDNILVDWTLIEFSEILSSGGRFLFWLIETERVWPQL